MSTPARRRLMRDFKRPGAAIRGTGRGWGAAGRGSLSVFRKVAGGSSSRKQHNGSAFVAPPWSALRGRPPAEAKGAPPRSLGGG
ncbi:hypothetical protein P7K49_038990 [Saguinus oedipus]|uniref:Uncharacterized protein n=1 Tax=Saguinus oedipus TaxID=9490 RepID=A0ABQ9TG95_SAGOE|nr:hypothetical protein P7K49_038990 [Saguinus oedipus]